MHVAKGFSLSIMGRKPYLQHVQEKAVREIKGKQKYIKYVLRVGQNLSKVKK